MALAKGGGRRGARLYRDPRHQAGRARHWLWLYQDRQDGHARRLRAQGRSFRRKARRRQGGSTMSPEIIFGIPAISSSAPMSCRKSCRNFEPEMAAAAAEAVAKAKTDLNSWSSTRTPSPGAEEIDRLRGHGAHQQGGGRPRRHRLVGCRQLGKRSGNCPNATARAIRSAAEASS